MFSTPILTAIFGDGSPEVRGLTLERQESFQNFFFRPGRGHRGLGRRRAYSDGGECSDYELHSFEFFPQECDQEVNSSEVRGLWEYLF